MKHLYKRIATIIFLIVSSAYTTTLEAQQNKYPWQLGVGIGYTNYYGDLSNYRIHGLNELYKIYRFGNYNSYYQNQPSLSILLQKKITPTLGIMFQANNLQFAMSDRYKRNNGSLDSSSSNYARALNFRTNMQDIGFAFTFSPNNGRIGSENAFFYPSFYLGLGVSKFDVKGNLYDAKNSPYNYGLPANDMDNSYETNLRDQRTETDDKFRNIEPYVDLGLALNFRINSQFSIALQSDIKYSASDYLDDVSGIYKPSYPTAAEAYAAKPGYNLVDPVTRQRGDNNGVNDFYINNRIVLNIALSKPKSSKKVFNSPVIYSLAPSYNYQNKVKDSVKTAIINADSIKRVKADSLRRALSDSLLQVQLSNQKIGGTIDSVLTQRFNNIDSALMGIRQTLYEQQVKPRLAQLQYQSDSIKLLRQRLLNQRLPGRESSLLLRVYDLQVDSLRYEYETVQRSKFLPSKKIDSLLILENYRTPGSEIINSINNNRAYSEDTALVYSDYASRLDSIQRRLQQLDNTVPTSHDSTYQQQPVSIRESFVLDSLSGVKKAETDLKLRQQEQDLATLRRQLNATNDSIGYYHKLKETQATTAVPDTVQKKIPWYSRYLGIGRKKNQSLNTDTTATEKYSLQQKFYESEAELAKSRIDKIEKDKADLALQTLKDARERKLRLDSIDYARNLEMIQAGIQQNTGSINSLKSQLKRSADSSTYYRQRLLEAEDVANAKRAAEADKKWYQEVFTSKQKRQNELAAASATGERNTMQQSYYDNDVRNMQNRINDLERRNLDLQNSYKLYNADRNDRPRIDFPTPPVVVYGGDNSRRTDSREIDDLRSQVQNLQNELNYDNKRKTVVDTTGGSKTQQIIVNPVPAATADTSMVSMLRTELRQLKSQLDSMSTRPLVVPAAPVTKPVAKYDVTSFPVISVYFKLGAVALSPDQLSKILPLVRIAEKNTEAVVVLKGFTDAVGDPGKNMIIANKRSDYIKNILLTKYKIKESLITVEAPELSEHAGGTKKANPLDRRVDLRLQ